MSAAVRTALATAASTVTGVTVTPYYKSSFSPGKGAVRLDRTARDSSGYGFMATWQVLVGLPTDYAAAEKWIDANASALVAALSPHLVVTGTRPEQWVLDSGAKANVLVIEGVRESE